VKWSVGSTVKALMVMRLTYDLVLAQWAVWQVMFSGGRLGVIAT